jgi:acetyl-CoA carboxylase carboxyltransferase component
VDSLNGYGGIFYRNTISSGVIPQLSVIAGPTAGGAVYSPALTDYIFMIDKTGIMHITGPSVIKAVTGEEVTSESLGGARSNNAKSGNAHFFAKDEEECFSQVKKLLGYLPSNNMEEPPVRESGDDPYRLSPRLREIVPTNPNKSYHVHEVLHEVLDGGEFFEVHEQWGTNIVIGYGRIGGQTVGIVANQASKMAGCLDIDCSDKASRFIRHCDAFNVPIVSFVDVPGLLAVYYG